MSLRPLLVLAVLAVTSVGCRDTTLPAQGAPCIEGRTRACACPDTNGGYQTCRVDGTWGLCVCGFPSAGANAGNAGTNATTGSGNTGQGMGQRRSPDGGRPNR